MVKRLLIILLSVQFRPDKFLLFLLGWQPLQLRHSSEMREKCAPVEPSLLPAGSLKQGSSALLHPPCTWRNIPAPGLWKQWKQKGGEMHTPPI